MKIISKRFDPNNIEEVVDHIFRQIRYHRGLAKFHREQINNCDKDPKWDPNKEERKAFYIKRFNHHSFILMKWQAVLPKYTAKL